MGKDGNEQATRRIGVLTIGPAPKGFAGLRRYPFVTLST